MQTETLMHSVLAHQMLAESQEDHWSCSTFCTQMHHWHKRMQEIALHVYMNAQTNLYGS